MSSNENGVSLIRSAAHTINRADSDFDALIDLAGAALFVLLGEASHGIHEFYSTRAEITRRLIREKGFQAVAVEADWPDAHRMNQYVRGRSGESHYFMARLADQFDAVIHFDQTCAVEPLPHAEEEQTSEAPETYPTGV